MTLEPLESYRGLRGRYLNLGDVQRSLRDLGPSIRFRSAGKSVQGRSIPLVEVGHGPFRILLWSQMHGNESTTTKALFDVLHPLSHGVDPTGLLERATLWALPMLNPDGAQRYTRANAAGVDLNRDALDQSQPESRALAAIFDTFNPNFCFNLHDQRTLYGVGDTGVGTVFAMLAPSADPERTVTSSRRIAMEVLGHVAQDLQKGLSGRLARYDDTFNPRCVGDAFQSHGVPTVLFEAGHSPDDYERETTRFHVARALRAALVRTVTLAGDEQRAAEFDLYRQLPPNLKNFQDLLLRSPVYLSPERNERMIAFQYREELSGEKIRFVPTEVAPRPFAHLDLDAAHAGDRAVLARIPGLREALGLV